MIELEEKYKEKLRKKIISKIFEDANGCKIWSGAKHQDGYGKLIIFKNGKKIHCNVHRLIWELFIGEIPEGKFVCHTCDITACCNLDHLFLGTPKENSQDMVRKGRNARMDGENNPKAVLTENMVREIRILKKQNMPTCKIAKFFNINYSTCLYAANGLNWKKVSV